jgi:peptidyl-prolyl cis-trans isomerase SurA
VAEIKILYKVENQIITNIDIKNEYNYLIALNQKLKNIDKDQMINIATESIINETVKKIEILKKFKNFDVNEDYIEVLIKKVYENLNINSKENFIEYLSLNNIELDSVIEKFKVESLWNELIIRKYSSQININKKEIEKELKENNKKLVKSFLLSEIYLNIDKKDEINIEYLKIKKSIEDIGFENTAAIYSASDTAKNAGLVGWVDESSLTNRIKSKIIHLKEEDFTEPIIMPGGILVLKIREIKQIKNLLDLEEELSKKINYEKSRQLNQFSKIYFNKIKKKTNIYEN